MRASTATEQRLSIGARKTADLSFGVTNFGSIAGRVYNDLLLAGASGTPLNNPGLVSVRVRLHRGELGGEAVGECLTDASGAYSFAGLSPGVYSVELDPATIPLDYRLPEQLSWSVTLAPLQTIY